MYSTNRMTSEELEKRIQEDMQPSRFLLNFEKNGALEEMKRATVSTANALKIKEYILEIRDYWVQYRELILRSNSHIEILLYSSKYHRVLRDLLMIRMKEIQASMC